MAKKAVQGKTMKQVRFTIDKKAFKGLVKCHTRTRQIQKKIVMDEMVFTYSVWQCPVCKKEYLDTKQAKRLEAIWTMEKLIDEKLLSMRRSLNYDGKMFFLRFPKELSKSWRKGQHADIKIIDTNKFIVEVE